MTVRDTKDALQNSRGANAPDELANAGSLSRNNETQRLPSALRLVPRLPKLPHTEAGENGNSTQLLQPLRAAEMPGLLSHGPVAHPAVLQPAHNPARAEPEAAADSPSRDPPGPLGCGAPAGSGRTERAPGRAPGQVREPPAAPASRRARARRCGRPQSGIAPPGAGPRRPEPRRSEGGAGQPRAAAARAAGDHSPLATTGAASLKADAKQIKEPVQSKKHTVPSRIPLVRDQGVVTLGTRIVRPGEVKRHG